MQSFATVGNSVTARAFQGGGMRAARRVADRLLVFGVIASTTLAASTWLAREHLPRLFTSDVACHLACQPAFLPVCLMVRTPLAHDSLPSSGARSDACTLSGGAGSHDGSHDTPITFLAIRPLQLDIHASGPFSRTYALMHMNADLSPPIGNDTGVYAQISLTWFKVPEGALLGVGDGRYLAMCYVPAAAVTMLQLLHTHVRGLGLRGVWFALAL